MELILQQPQVLQLGEDAPISRDTRINKNTWIFPFGSKLIFETLWPRVLEKTNHVCIK